ncbi:MAG TPA: hypothetical protein PLB78_12750 [Anaerolineae bacterium]|nr:hypothetical protein [Anaerolineae bacterium]
MLIAAEGLARRHWARWAAFASALLLVGCTAAALLTLHGAAASLRLAQEQLSADIVVVPAAAAGHVETMLLGEATLRIWMPDDTVTRIAAVPGVAAAWPRLYLPALQPAPSFAGELPLIAFDPTTDVALRPWLARHLPQRLGPIEAIAGSGVALAQGQEAILAYGCPVALAGHLEPTGTRLDRSLFMTTEAMHDLARRSQTAAPRPLEVPLAGISAALVRVAPGHFSRDVAREIRSQVPGVATAQAAGLFQAERARIRDLRAVLQAGLGAVGIVLSALLALIVAPAAPARSPILAAARARLAPALRPALAGAALGAGLAGPAACLFGRHAAASLGLPLLLPSTTTLAAVSMAALALGIVAGGWPRLHGRRALSAPMSAILSPGHDVLDITRMAGRDSGPTSCT